MNAHPDRNRWIEMSEEQFSKLCRFEFFKSSGPGGQKVNKTSSAVRIVHLPSGIETVSSENRRQSENRKHALKKLKMKMAMNLRCPEKPCVKNFEMNLSNPKYPLLLALIFDALHICGFRIKETAEFLSLSAGQLNRIIQKNPPAWQKVNQERKKRGMKNLFI